MDARLSNVFAVTDAIPEKDRSLAADYESLAIRIDKEVRNPLHKAGALKALQDSRDEFMQSSLKDEKRRLQIEKNAKHNEEIQAALKQRQEQLQAEAAELRGEPAEPEAEADAIGGGEPEKADGPTAPQ